MIVDEEVEEFLEHFGVRGQKWGVRRQKHLDRVARVAAGTASRNERGAVRRTSGTITKKSAERELRLAAKKQENHEKTMAFLKKHSKGISMGVGAVGIAATSAILSRRGMVSIKQARHMANQKAAMELVKIHRNVVLSNKKNAIDFATSDAMKKLLFSG